MLKVCLTVVKSVYTIQILDHFGKYQCPSLPALPRVDATPEPEICRESFSVYQFGPCYQIFTSQICNRKKCLPGPELCSVLVLALAPADNTRAAFSFENGFKYTWKVMRAQVTTVNAAVPSWLFQILAYDPPTVPWRSMNLFCKTLGSHATPCFAGCTTWASGSKLHNFGGTWNSQPHGLACYVYICTL